MMRVGKLVRHLAMVVALAMSAMACDSSDHRLAQVSMTPAPGGSTPKAMKTIGSMQPTPEEAGY